jgi:hypothetical protein
MRFLFQNLHASVRHDPVKVVFSPGESCWVTNLTSCTGSKADDSNLKMEKCKYRNIHKKIIDQKFVYTCVHAVPAALAPDFMIRGPPESP